MNVTGELVRLAYYELLQIAQRGGAFTGADVECGEGDIPEADLNASIAQGFDVTRRIMVPDIIPGHMVEAQATLRVAAKYLNLPRMSLFLRTTLVWQPTGEAQVYSTTATYDPRLDTLELLARMADGDPSLQTPKPDPGVRESEDVNVARMYYARLQSFAGRLRAYWESNPDWVTILNAAEVEQSVFGLPTPDLSRLTQHHEDVVRTAQFATSMVTMLAPNGSGKFDPSELLTILLWLRDCDEVRHLL